MATTLAAIDIGSNAIRLVIGELDAQGELKILKKMREPVRLGKDVFAGGLISPKTQGQAIASFLKFREQLRAHGVSRVRAVATSALREAQNRDAFIADVKKASGVSIDVIDGVEEGRLVFAAVAHKVDLHEKISLLIDIGGGSVELTIADHGVPKATQTFKMGTVRLLQMIEDRGLKEKQLRGLIQELMAPVKAFLAPHISTLHIDQAIGTGGNFECLGKLRVALLEKNSIFSMTRLELGTLVSHLESMSIHDRIEYLRLRPDRADVVVPAALVTIAIMELADVEKLKIPYVGLREGILAKLSELR